MSKASKKRRTEKRQGLAVTPAAAAPAAPAPTAPVQECGDPGTPTPVAVVDTNVIIDTYSYHDFIAALQPRSIVMGEASLDDPYVRYRKQRARDAVVLVMHLSRTKAVTCSYHQEGEQQMLKVVPPRSKGGITEDVVFTEFAVWFIYDRVLDGWMPATFGVRTALKGNKADAFIAAHAKRHGVPLITNEGFRDDMTIVDEGLRLVAKRQGVDVFTPGEYLRHRSVNQSEAIDEFFQSFGDLAPKYLEERKRRYGRQDKGQHVMDHILRYYRYVLDA